MTDTRLSVRITNAYLWQLKALAAEYRMTLTELVKVALEEYAESRGSKIVKLDEEPVTTPLD